MLVFFLVAENFFVTDFFFKADVFFFFFFFVAGDADAFNFFEEMTDECCDGLFLPLETFTKGTLFFTSLKCSDLALSSTAATGVT